MHHQSIRYYFFLRRVGMKPARAFARAIADHRQREWMAAQ